MHTLFDRIKFRGHTGGQQIELPIKMPWDMHTKHTLWLYFEQIRQLGTLHGIEIHTSLNRV